MKNNHVSILMLLAIPACDPGLSPSDAELEREFHEEVEIDASLASLASEPSDEDADPEQPRLQAEIEPDTAASPYAVPFFGRAEDLAADEVWFMGGTHGSGSCGPSGDLGCAHDIAVLRWDAGGGTWSQIRAGGSSSDSTDDVAWGKSLYSMTDGEVIACWRNFPDHDTRGENPFDCECNLVSNAISCDSGNVGDAWVPCNTVMTSSGNALWIRDTAGNVVSYSHMMEDSIPASLCPNNPTDVWPSVLEDEFAYPPEFLTERNFRPQVRRGDYIGRVGHSGRSWNPHLHTMVEHQQFDSASGNFIRGADREFFFSQAWYQNRSLLSSPLGTWNQVEDQPLDELFVNGGRVLLWPDPILSRSSDLDFGEVSQVGSSWASDVGTTAFRNNSGNLGIRTWTNTNGQLVPRNTVTVGAVSQMDIASISGRNVATAVRNGDGNLALISWAIGSTGEIDRRDTTTRGRISGLSIARGPASSGTGVVTAVINGTGVIQVDGWQVDPTTLAFNRGSTSGVGGTVSEVEITSISNARLAGQTGSFDGAVTAEVTSTGALRVRTWSMDGWAVTARDSELAGSVSDIEITTVTRNGLAPLVVVAVRNGSGDLQLVAWEVDQNGDLHRRGSIDAGPIGQVAIAGAGTNELLVSVRGGDDQLVLVEYAVLNDGTFRRAGTIEGNGTIAAADVDVSGSFANSYAVSTVRTSAGTLKLISWPLNLDSSI